jgi:hypothetical protein
MYAAEVRSFAKLWTGSTMMTMAAKAHQQKLHKPLNEIKILRRFTEWFRLLVRFFI